MAILVIEPGLQTTIQAGPRRGLRHLGVPASGAADPLSMALANRLLGNPLEAPVLEVTLSRVVLGFEEPAVLAIAGAPADAVLGAFPAPLHETLETRSGDELRIGAAPVGARVYLAVAGGFAADEVLESGSTYLPAGLGGLHGRALARGDRLQMAGHETSGAEPRTPARFRPTFGRSWAVRASSGCEFELLASQSRIALFDSNFVVDGRADRMGLRLTGRRLSVKSGGRMASAPVFPGAVQCPENGQPFVLSVDAQTTGGYPRVAQVARCDRHMLGQLRPGDHLRLLRRDAEGAAADLAAKHDAWREWLPEVDTIL